MSVLLYSVHICLFLGFWCVLSALIYYLMGGGHESGLQLILQHEITAGGGGGTEGEGERAEGEHCKSGPCKKGISNSTNDRRNNVIGI
jgi:hypothetical protein